MLLAFGMRIGYGARRHQGGDDERQVYATLPTSLGPVDSAVRLRSARVVGLGAAGEVEPGAGSGKEGGPSREGTGQLRLRGLRTGRREQSAVPRRVARKVQARGSEQALLRGLQGRGDAGHQIHLRPQGLLYGRRLRGQVLRLPQEDLSPSRENALPAAVQSAKEQRPQRPEQPLHRRPQRRAAPAKQRPGRRQYLAEHHLLHQLVGGWDQAAQGVRTPRLHQDQRAGSRHRLQLRSRAREPQDHRLGGYGQRGRGVEHGR